ncbi:hypothetical protein [Acinetobacter oleivorans]|uniref:hypothetical protein n=1 Tax=Acinetobacter oleivorans TaxID=1148157 RepID=UPI00125009D8|nr:hypothetical protein [Acinetobacter oleivorans]
MKPEQFIREFGVDKARDLLNQREKFIHVEKPTHFDTDLEIFIHEADFRTGKLDESDIDLSDLKRLVESLERVKHRGGLSKTKDHLDYLISFGSEFAGVSKEEIKQLQQDVAAHESIYGGGDE